MKKKWFSKEKGLCEYGCLVLLFVLFYSYRIFFTVLIATPGIQTPQDLFSTIYPAAMLAGNDWTAIGKNYSAYYGYGFSSLFAVLFLLFDDGLLIYRIMATIFNAIPFFSALICYKIINLFSLTISKWSKALMAVACSSFVGMQYSGVSNEYPLTVCIWLYIYLILLLSNETMVKKKNMYTFWLITLIGYACTVHSRAVVLFLLLFCVILFHYLINKVNIMPLWAILYAFVVFLLYRVVTNAVQSVLLGKVDANSSIIAHAANGTKAYSSLESYFIHIISYINETNIITCGLFGIAIISFSVHIIKKVLKNDSVYDTPQDYLSSIGIISFGGWFLFAFGMAFSVRTEVYRGITDGEMRDFLRYLVLIRYFLPFIGPALLFLFIKLIANKNVDKKDVIKVGFLFDFVVLLAYYIIVIPKISYTGWADSIYSVLTFGIKNDRKDVYLIGGFIIPFMIFLFSILLLSHDRMSALYIIIILTTILFQTNHYMDKFEKNAITYVDGGYRDLRNSSYVDVAVRNFDEDGEVFKDPIFLYQIMLPKLRISIIDNNEQNYKGVILTNKIINTDYENYTIKELDDNEWILISVGE